MRARRPTEFKKPPRGVVTLELALLTPTLLILFLAIVQIIIYVQSSTATQYATFMAARAYQVYGERTLGNIHYRHTRPSPYTNSGQTIPEAVAEKVIFESLLWEHKRIDVDRGGDMLDRTYRDGNDVARNGMKVDPTRGAVQINYQSFVKDYGLAGTEVTYCMPIVFPGIDRLFALAKEEYPCHVSRTEKPYNGIAIVKKIGFGREPLTP